MTGTIEDDDEVPFITMKLENVTNNTIVEGESIEVSIATGDIVPPADNPILLDVNITQVGNYIAFRVPRSIELTSTTSSRTIRIATLDDNLEEDDGSITNSIFQVRVMERTTILNRTFPPLQLKLLTMKRMELFGPNQKIEFRSLVTRSMKS